MPPAIALAHVSTVVCRRMPIDTILTHPGGAHKDEFLACSVMAALHEVPIVRREPTGADLADPGVCVIDVGGEHDPAKNNFDHHQLPREGVPVCALSLVLQSLGLYEDARFAFEWMEPAEWFDVRGPSRTAAWLGVERRVISQLSSPIDMSLLRCFAGATRWARGDSLYQIMQIIGDDMVIYLQTLRQRLENIAVASELWTLEVAGESFSALFLPRQEQMADEPSMGLGQYVHLRGLEKEVAALVYPDRRSAGYGLSRFQDHPRLDFTRTRENADVHFAHAGGFVAKTTATRPERLRELLVQAWS